MKPQHYTLRASSSQPIIRAAPEELEAGLLFPKHAEKKGGSQVCLKFWKIHSAQCWIVIIGWIDVIVLFPFSKNWCERPNKRLWRMIMFKTTWAKVTDFMAFTTKNIVTLVIVSKYVKWKYKIQSFMTINYKYFGTTKMQQRRAHSGKKGEKVLKVKISFFFIHSLEVSCAVNVPWTFNTPSHCSVFPFQLQNEVTENNNIQLVCLILYVCPLGVTLLNINLLCKVPSLLSSFGLIICLFIYLLV